MDSKENIIKKIKNAGRTNEKNSMGCNESWYNCYYAIQQTFSIEKLENMSCEELNDLVELADNIADAFY